MLTVIFNEGLASELTYQFNTYSETYSAYRQEVLEPLWMLKFERNGSSLLNINGNLGDYLADLFNPSFHIETIDVYDETNTKIDHFDDYPYIHECVTLYEEFSQLQRSELRLVRELPSPPQRG